MPYRDPDPEDPMALVGVEIESGEENLEEMAYIIAEEYAQIGFDEERLLRVFRNPYFRSAHQAWTVLGEMRTTEILREALGFWGRFRFVDRTSGRNLVQLEVSEAERARSCRSSNNQQVTKR